LALARPASSTTSSSGATPSQSSWGFAGGVSCAPATAMIIRGITKPDFDHIVVVLDRWWGGPAGERAHPILFYELGQQALIAEESGEMVGFLLGFIAPTTPPIAYVHLVGIHPDQRRQGVGQQLYERFTDQAKRAGAAKIKAITTVGNEGS